VVVSTDSARYAALARAAGAEVPFVRPAALATGCARLIDVVLHALAALEQRGEIFDVVIMLSAATPLTAVGDVRRALQRCRRLGVSAVSVTAETTPDAYRFGLERGRLAAARTPHISRRQEGTPRVRLNGAVYVATPAWLRRFRQFVRANRTVAIVMPRERSLDVENALDLDVVRHFWRQENRRRV
jgi:CMP-N-acetylneuraminic acid synthetase